jgi:hypothetical protein
MVAMLPYMACKVVFYLKGRYTAGCGSDPALNIPKTLCSRKQRSNKGEEATNRKSD